MSYSHVTREASPVQLLALVTSLTQQFAVLLLAHPLAALLDDGTHLKPPFLLPKDCNSPNTTRIQRLWITTFRQRT